MPLLDWRRFRLSCVTILCCSHNCSSLALTTDGASNEDLQLTTLHSLADRHPAGHLRVQLRQQTLLLPHLQLDGVRAVGQLRGVQGASDGRDVAAELHAAEHRRVVLEYAVKDPAMPMSHYQLNGPHPTSSLTCEISSWLVTTQSKHSVESFCSSSRWR